MNAALEVGDELLALSHQATLRHGAGVEAALDRLDERDVLVGTIDPALEETPARWNEVWSSLRNDEELRPLVQERYRAWIERVVRLLEEGREDGSVPRSVDPAGAGWRLAAAADGLDSILYVGLLDRDAARVLLASYVIRELEW